MSVTFKSVTDIDWHWKFLGYVDNQENPRFIMGYKKGKGNSSVLIDSHTNKNYPTLTQQEGINKANKLVANKEIILFI